MKQTEEARPDGSAGITKNDAAASGARRRAGTSENEACGQARLVPASPDGSRQPPEDEGRNQFTFYRSFYNALMALPKRSRPQLALAIIEYGLYGRTKTPTDSSVAGMLELVAPVLDAARRRADAGARGGRASKERGKTQAKRKQNASEKEGEKEIEKESEKEKEKEYENEQESVSLCADGETERAVKAVEEAVGPLNEAQLAEVRGYVRRCGAGAVYGAVKLGREHGAKSWSYLRKTLDGGVKPAFSPLRRHDEPLSPMMRAAIERSLAEEVTEP